MRWWRICRHCRNLHSVLVPPTIHLLLRRYLQEATSKGPRPSKVCSHGHGERGSSSNQWRCRPRFPGSQREERCHNQITKGINHQCSLLCICVLTCAFLRLGLLNTVKWLAASAHPDTRDVVLGIRRERNNWHCVLDIIKNLLLHAPSADYSACSSQPQQHTFLFVSLYPLSLYTCISLCICAWFLVFSLWSERLLCMIWRRRLAAQWVRLAGLACWRMFVSVYSLALDGMDRLLRICWWWTWYRIA